MKITEQMAAEATREQIRLWSLAALGDAMKMAEPFDQELESGDYLTICAAARATADLLAKTFGPKLQELADHVADDLLRELVTRSGLPSLEKH